MSYKQPSPIVVSEGGTGKQSFTTYALVCGGTTITNPLQSVGGVGAAGEVLTSNGAGMLPSWQALPAGGITSITGDTGGAQAGPAITFAGGTTGLSFGGAANTITTTFAGITANNGTVNLGTDNAANAITIGTGTTGRAINIGRSAAAHTITFGNTNTTTSVDIASGTGNMLLNSAGTNTLTGTGGVTIQSTNTAIGVTSGTGTVSISADATANTLNLGTGAGVKTVTLGSTNSTSATTVQSGSGALNVTSTNGALTINSGTGALSISSDASATTVNIATGGAVKTSTFGSTNSTSATTVQSGSGALNITSSNGAITMNSGTGTVAIGNDATAATYNFATGAGAKVVTLGSTNGASSLALKYGTADFSLASATGNVIVALDTGETTMPLQPAFSATMTTAVTNVTGDGTSYTIIFDNEVYDQSSDFNLGTSTFTAPVTGRYHFSIGVYLQELAVAFTDMQFNLVTSNRSYRLTRINPGVIIVSGFLQITGSAYSDMDSADTATVTILVSGSTKTVDVVGSAGTPGSFFGGVLVC